jgi:hypothetical protein
VAERYKVRLQWRSPHFSAISLLPGWRQPPGASDAEVAIQIVRRKK